MAIAEWHEEYCTGHPQIDQQHRHLFNLVNQVHAHLQSAAPAVHEMRSLLQEFSQCALTHFDLEETLMRDYRYPNRKAHTGIHQRLVAKVEKLLERWTQLEQVSFADIETVTSILADWMIHHIQGEDQRMIQFF